MTTDGWGVAPTDEPRRLLMPDSDDLREKEGLRAPGTGGGGDVGMAGSVPSRVVGRDVKKADVGVVGVVLCILAGAALLHGG